MTTITAGSSTTDIYGGRLQPGHGSLGPRFLRCNGVMVLITASRSGLRHNDRTNLENKSVTFSTLGRVVVANVCNMYCPKVGILYCPDTYLQLAFAFARDGWHSLSEVWYAAWSFNTCSWQTQGRSIFGRYGWSLMFTFSIWFYYYVIFTQHALAISRGWWWQCLPECSLVFISIPNYLCIKCDCPIWFSPHSLQSSSSDVCSSAVVLRWPSLSTLTGRSLWPAIYTNSHTNWYNATILGHHYVIFLIARHIQTFQISMEGRIGRLH